MSTDLVKLEDAVKALAEIDPLVRVHWIMWLFEALEEETKS